MVLLVAGVVGGAVIHAQTPSATAPPAANPEKAFADKVAGILGVDAAKVESAFTQAQKEMQNEALKTRLNLVKAGKITQDRPDQYQKWWDSRPDVPIALSGTDRPNGSYEDLAIQRRFPRYAPGLANLLQPLLHQLLPVGRRKDEALPSSVS